MSTTEKQFMGEMAFADVLEAWRIKYGVAPSHDLKADALNMINRFDKVFADYAKLERAKPEVVAENAYSLKTMRRMFGVIMGQFIEDSQIADYKMEAELYRQIAKNARQELDELKTILGLKSLAPDRLKMYEVWSDAYLEGNSNSASPEAMVAFDEARERILKDEHLTK